MSLIRTPFPRKPPPPSKARVKIYCGPPATPRATVQTGKATAQEVKARPKRVYVRSKKLREAFRLLPCQFDDDLPTICGAILTMCCHSNWSAIGGKGKSIKADDSRAASGCHTHHHELDQGTAWSYEQRVAFWWRAHVRSVRLLVALGAWPKTVPVPDLETNPLGRTNGE